MQKLIATSTLKTSLEVLRRNLEISKPNLMNRKENMSESSSTLRLSLTLPRKTFNKTESNLKEALCESEVKDAKIIELERDRKNNENAY